MIHSPLPTAQLSLAPDPSALRSSSANVTLRDDLPSHAHANVLGVKISAVSLSEAVEIASQWIAEQGILVEPGYVCATGVHGVIEAQADPNLLRILNRAVVNVADGMPMSWVGRAQGLSMMHQVTGSDFMAAMCHHSVDRGFRHFLYGGNPGVAEQLKAALQAKFPGLQVVGTYTPPFRDLNMKEEQELFAQVRKAKPDIVWVGLSTPKQERFMARYANALGVPLLASVGAAFDFHTGKIRESPQWMKRAGLQWLHRLLQEPRRLWKRYLKNNPRFLALIALQLSGLRRYTPD